MPDFLHQLTTQLRRRGLTLGIDDIAALRQVLAAGLGWSSDRSLLNVCIALWAKSASEAEIIRATFPRVKAPTWTTEETPGPAAAPTPVIGEIKAGGAAAMSMDSESGRPTVPPASQPVISSGGSGPVTQPVRGFPAMPPATGRHDATLVTEQQYPLSARQIAQTWRGLRRPRRDGPAIELDVAETLHRYAVTGVATPPVLVPRRRNSAKLLLVIDRQGSMTPFHDYVDHLTCAVMSSARLDTITVAYFHNTAGHSPDRQLIATMDDPFSTSVDLILPAVPPLGEGHLYADDALTEPRWLSSVLRPLPPETGVVVISDGGAARGRLVLERLLDTVALLKALTRDGRMLAWLNPLPASTWNGATAGQLARHVPMYELTRDGMYRAVDVLRGRPVELERPL
ncbi:VWA domain-containing protein [Actinoplanes sp. NPDC023801]|uniref:VWA domain-containing protein n=1 Tax=Actinoplanes sp. NPDC023801 TaxID=3154595 RepID=UPI0033DB8298